MIGCYCKDCVWLIERGERRAIMFRLPRSFLMSLPLSVFLLWTLSCPSEARKFRIGAANGAIKGVAGAISEKKIYTSDVLNLSELEACVKLEDDIEVRKNVLSASSMSINVLQTQVQQKKKQIEELESLIDRYSQSDINRINREIQKFNELNDFIRNKISQHNNDVREAMSYYSAFNARCARKSYYESDLIVVRAKLDKNR
jgi:hypothetical protein